MSAATSETGEKEKIFRRIREALTVPAPHPGDHGGGGHETGVPVAPAHEIAHWLPLVGDGFEAQAELFPTVSVNFGAQRGGGVG